MHEVDLKQDEKVVTLVIDCSSIEDANRLYLLLEQIFLDDKEQKEKEKDKEKEYLIGKMEVNIKANFSKIR